jgi:DNA modification methylase
MLPGIELCAYGKRSSAKFLEFCKPGVWHDGPDSERLHPNQKPLRIISQQILASTDADDTILDPFMGSGTTLRAAKDLGRKAIGIEIDERYCEIATKRMSQMVLPL